MCVGDAVVGCAELGAGVVGAADGLFVGAGIDLQGSLAVEVHAAPFQKHAPPTKLKGLLRNQHPCMHPQQSSAWLHVAADDSVVGKAVGELVVGEVVIGEVVVGEVVVGEVVIGEVVVGEVVGAFVGAVLGDWVGPAVGTIVGPAVGGFVGPSVGPSVGAFVGLAVGGVEVVSAVAAGAAEAAQTQ